MDTTLTHLLDTNFSQLSPMFPKPQCSSQHLRASDIHGEPVATGMYVNNVQRSRELESTSPGTSSGTGDATQWLGSNSVPREDLNSLNLYPLLPLLFSLSTYLSCSTYTEGDLILFDAIYSVFRNRFSSPSHASARDDRS